MRRLLILLTLILMLAATFQLSRLAQDWHYVVPAEPGELLYATGFDGGADDWEQTIRRDKSQEVLNGRMRLTVETAQNGVFSAAGPYFSDFDVTVDATTLDGPLDNGFGVIFRQLNDGTYYIFLISADGFYRVKRLDNNVSKVLHNWHTSSLINTGVGATNQLRVIGIGDRFRFFINGEPVELCIPDNPDDTSTPLADGTCQDGQWRETLVDDTIPYGHIGVTVEVDRGQPPGVVVGFDRFIVRGPEPFE